MFLRTTTNQQHPPWWCSSTGPPTLQSAFSSLLSSSPSSKNSLSSPSPFSSPSSSSSYFSTCQRLRVAQLGRRLRFYRKGGGHQAEAADSSKAEINYLRMCRLENLFSTIIHRSYSNSEIAVQQFRGKIMS